MFKYSSPILSLWRFATFSLTRRIRPLPAENSWVGVQILAALLKTVIPGEPTVEEPGAKGESFPLDVLAFSLDLLVGGDLSECDLGDKTCQTERENQTMPCDA